MIDWRRFYETRDEDLDRWIGTRKLLSNQEAVGTGLLLCEYSIFDTFFLDTLFFISLLVMMGDPVISVIIIFSFIRIGRGADCVQPGARSPSLSTKQCLVVCVEGVM